MSIRIGMEIPFDVHVDRFDVDVDRLLKCRHILYVKKNKKQKETFKYVVFMCKT